jgi:hypothetical protein
VISITVVSDGAHKSMLKRAISPPEELGIAWMDKHREFAAAGDPQCHRSLTLNLLSQFSKSPRFPTL